MKKRIALCAVLLLVACSTTPKHAAPPMLFADAQFGAAPAELQNLDLFAVSPAMQEFLTHEVPKYIRRDGASRGLYEAMRAKLRIDYDASTTRTAAETFDAKAGNCLSLVVLTAALARPLNIDVRYRFVPRVRTWTRTQGMLLQNGHVNIALSPRMMAGSGVHPALIVDFVPAEDLETQVAREIEQNEVTAMYLNNRAAEIMVAGDSRAAYWWARAAIAAAPEYAPAYNTLGVIYLRHGEAPLAERVFRFQLATAADDPMLLSNLAVALDHQGRTADAALVRQQIARLDRYQPFSLLDKGNAAIANGDARTALKFYRQELKHIPYSSELHFAMAVAEARLGHRDDAQAQLDLAMKLSINLTDRDLYAGKLEKLRSLQAN